MTKKDYVLIAAALKGARGECPLVAMIAGYELAVEYVTDALARDNPRFDRARFLKAAGVACESATGAGGVAS